MVVYTFNPSTWESEAGGLQVYPCYILRHFQEMKEKKEGGEEKEEKRSRKRKKSL